MPFLTANGAKFHFEIDDFTDPWSEAETVVIQHGFGRSSRFWYRWVPYLARHYRVIRRDMRGHGQSEDPGVDYEWSVEGLLSDLLAFFDALELESVHYVGESIGGMQGVAVASRWPDRIETLTACSTPIAIRPSRDDAGFFSTGGMSWNEALLALGVGGWVDSQMGPGSFAGSDGPPDRRQWLVEQWDKTSRLAAASFQDAVVGFDIAPLLSTLTVPTLVVAPTRSKFQSLESQVQFYERIPRATFAAVDGPGHEIYFDRAEECATLVRRFIESIKPG